jgi:hypothetical protein
MKVKKLLKQKFQDFEFWFHRTKLAYKKGHFSNFGEQKVIEKYIEQLQIFSLSQTIVDIGAGDGIHMSNTYNFFMNGWSGLGVEFDSRQSAKLSKAYKFYPNVFASRCQITPDNVNNLLKTYSIEKNFGILSLDIDGYDFWVLEAILTEFRPCLIVSEYNEKIPPPIKFAVNFDIDFTLRHHFFGYSISKLSDLLTKFNYVLLEVEYNNVFLAPAELKGAKPIEIVEAYQQGYLNRADRHEKFKPNGNLEILHSLTPEAGLEFLNKFYTKFRGKYQIELE